MNGELIPFQRVLDTLRDDDKDIPDGYLTQFSDIEPGALKSLQDTWPRIGLSRKLLLLDLLNTLASEDTLVSFDDLGRALLTDDEPEVRVRAMRLLVECEDARLVPSYIEMVTKDSNVDVRAEAASMLGLFVQLGEFEDIPADVHHRIEDVLLEVLNGEDDSSVRRRALEALGFSSRLEVPVLIESAFNRQDPAWQASAIFAMGRTSDDKRWDDHVLQMIVSENRRIRLAAVQASGELALALARPLLLRLLEDEFDEVIAGAAIWSLSQIGGEDVRLYLQNLLDKVEDDDQAALLEEALDNLAFTEDKTLFDLLALDADDLDQIDVDD
jgi:HEAT repeat protein